MMHKFLLGAAIGLYFILTPAISLADDKQNPPKGKTDRGESLQHTEQRLDDLIKAAAEQNLVNIQTGVKKTPKPAAPTSTIANKDKKKAETKCTSTDIFSFPTEANITSYSQLLAIKNGMVVGPDQIDKAKGKTLAFAYLGLGFSEEALQASLVLNDHDANAIHAMAKVLMETADARDKNFLQTQTACYKNAQIWLDALNDQSKLLSELQIKQINDRLTVLPIAVHNILGQRIGLRALQNGDLQTAKAIHKALLGAVAIQAKTQPSLPSPDLKFYEAMLAVNSSKAETKISGINTLKPFAETSGIYQIYALQVLSENLPSQTDIYPGYVQDLDAALQTYSDNEKGEQARKQKISYLAQKHSFNRAVQLAKVSFDMSSPYLQESAQDIAQYVLADLSSKDSGKQINALDALIREVEFFSSLEEITLLKQTGVSTCAQLGLLKLAEKLVPIAQWKNLDVETQNLLAIRYVSDNQNPHAKTIFLKQVLAQEEVKASELTRAFINRKPPTAMQIQRNNLDSKVVQTAFAEQAWTAGYWSLVDNQLRAISKPGSEAQTNLSKEQQDLVASLSTTSSLLGASNKQYDIGELNSLQTYLKHDIEVFEAYLHFGSPQSKAQAQVQAQIQANDNG